MLIHVPVDPCDVRCKWCKGWKSQERVSPFDVRVQTVMQ